MTPLFDLSGKVALVTGSRTGLGQAIAFGLAHAGAAIVGVDRGAADQTEESIRRVGGHFSHIKADLGVAGAPQRVAAEAQQAIGPIDILINNAGIIRRADALDFSEQDWDDVIDVNLKAPFFLAQAVARDMIARGKRGKIINIASMLSFQGGIRVASYTSAKSGIVGLTRLLACEWAAKGVNVNAIAPGYIETDNTAPLRADAERNAQILGRIPAGRWGKPEDLQGAAIFLSSHASDYMHGAVIPIDGGWLAR
jgi:2-deoxy-D-gluconate 3-dehydrogenase